MMKIIIISLLMVQVIIFFLQIILKYEFKNNKIINFFYFVIPTINCMLYVKLGISAKFIMYSILICFLLVISVVDFYTMYIYDITIISGIIVQGFIILVTKSVLINHLIGLAFGFLIPYIMFKITRGIGSGDIGVYALCCFCTGINHCLYIIPASFIIGGIYSIYLITIRKKSKDSYIPFAPCILLGTLMVILL